MKKLLILAAAAIMAAAAQAENLQKVVFTPSPKMTCQKCENYIKKTIRFVKGTKSIETSLKDQTVTVVFDADKATIADYQTAIKQIKRELTVVSGPLAAAKDKK